MPINHSPLRYPGGKQVLAKLIAHLVRLNDCTGGTYVEPFAGGGSVALSLLFGEHVSRVVINDADRCIYAMWKSIVSQTESFLRLLRETPLSVEEWERQREIYVHARRHSLLKVGFATFFLNRCNRSGIIARGGVIGGKDQTGKWKIDARFTRDELARRVEKIALFGSRIAISNLDAVTLLRDVIVPASSASRTFVYLDPPYYAKGRDLYLNFYEHDDHASLAEFIKTRSEFRWVMSYDCVKPIASLYEGLRQVSFSLDYTARERRQGTELLIFRDDLVFPSKWKRTIPSRFISSAADAPALPLR